MVPHQSSGCGDISRRPTSPGECSWCDAQARKKLYTSLRNRIWPPQTIGCVMGLELWRRLRTGGDSYASFPASLLFLEQNT